MKNFKVLTASLFNVALMLSSGFILAGENPEGKEVPNFYYLKDISNDFFSVQACFLSQGQTPLESSELDCPVVAQVSKSHLEYFLDHFLHEAEHYMQLPFVFRGADYLFRGKGSNVLLAWYAIMAKRMPLISIFGISNLSFIRYMDTKPSGQEHKNTYRIGRALKEQVRAGIVGQTPDDREEILQIFRDYLDKFGTKPQVIKSFSEIESLLQAIPAAER